MASIGLAWADGAFVQAGWVVSGDGAWLLVETPEWPHDLAGVANANIFRVNGLEKGQIAKIGGKE